MDCEHVVPNWSARDCHTELIFQQELKFMIYSALTSNSAPGLKLRISRNTGCLNLDMSIIWIALLQEHTPAAPAPCPTAQNKLDMFMIAMLFQFKKACNRHVCTDKLRMCT